MAERKPNTKHLACPAEFTAELLGGRWKIVLLWYLFQGVQRFSDLQRAIPGITQKVLTHQLRDMEKNGLLKRTVYPEIPPRVEYQITALGVTLKPVVDAMHQWGQSTPHYGRRSLAPDPLRAQAVSYGLSANRNATVHMWRMFSLVNPHHRKKRPMRSGFSRAHFSTSDRFQASLWR